MTEHELTIRESGSREAVVTHEDGEWNEERERYRKEMFVEAECSCGKDFLDEDEAYDHVQNPNK